MFLRFKFVLLRMFLSWTTAEDFYTFKDVKMRNMYTTCKDIQNIHIRVVTWVE